MKQKRELLKRSMEGTVRLPPGTELRAATRKPATFPEAVDSLPRAVTVNYITTPACRQE